MLLELRRGDKILDRLTRSSSDSLSDTEILFLYSSTRDLIAIWLIWDWLGGAGAGRRLGGCGSKWLDKFLYEAQYEGGGSRFVKLADLWLLTSFGDGGSRRWIRFCEAGKRYSFGELLLLAAKAKKKKAIR